MVLSHLTSFPMLLIFRCIFQHLRLKNAWMRLLQNRDKRFEAIITVDVEKAAQSFSRIPHRVRNLDACKLQRMHIGGYFYLMTKATLPHGRFTIPLTTHLAPPTLGNHAILMDFFFNWGALHYFQLSAKTCISIFMSLLQLPEAT